MSIGVIPVQSSATSSGADAAGWRSGVDLGQLTHDHTVVGLTIDQVSVVRIGDRAVVVPVPLELAEQSGFDVVATSPEALYAIGVRPPPGEPVPVARPVDADPATRWIAPVDAVPREPEVEHAGEVVDADAGAGDGFMAELPAEPGVAEDDAAPIEPARPVAVPGLDRREWPVDGEQPSWPAVERRIGDRRELPMLAWGQAGSFLPSTRSFVDGEVLVAAGLSNQAAIADEAAGSTDRGPRAIATRDVEIAGGEFVDERAEPAVALVGVALSATPDTAFAVRIAPGDVVVITGATGSGKTSLLRVLAGVEAPASGEVTVGGERLDLLRDDQRLVREAIGIGFVSAPAHLVPDLTVVENVEIPLLAGGLVAEAARTAASALLDHWRLGALAGRPAGQLSTTEQRCAVLARALVAETPLVLADDPTLGLDADVAADVIALLVEPARKGSAVIVVTSDPRVVLSGVRHLTLEAGEITSDLRVPATSPVSPAVRASGEPRSVALA